jgi:steroid delta-isomerase-like uncharacterized protein
MADLRALFEQRAQAWARRDAAALASGYAEDAVVTSPMFPGAEGRAAIEKSFVSLFRVFPDWEMTFEPTCVDPDGTRVMQACHVRATQRGDFMGIGATGKRVEFDCVLIMDVGGGLIARERRIYDFTGVLIQLGVLRSKPAM